MKKWKSGSIYFEIVSRHRPGNFKTTLKSDSIWLESLAAFHRNGWQGLRRIIHFAGFFAFPAEKVGRGYPPKQPHISNGL